MQRAVTDNASAQGTFRQQTVSTTTVDEVVNVARHTENIAESILVVPCQQDSTTAERITVKTEDIPVKMTVVKQEDGCSSDLKSDSGTRDREDGGNDDDDDNDDHDEDDDHDDDDDDDYDADEDDGDDMTVEDDDNCNPKTKTKKSKKPAKDTPRRRQQRVTTAREFVARLHQKEDEKFAKESQSNGKRKPANPKGPPFKIPKIDRPDTISRLQSDMLGATNQAESAALPMPEIKAHTHQRQLALMYKSIPEGSNTRRTQTQMKDLEEAKSLFGYRKVQAENGKWKLKGMKSALSHYQITAVAWMVKRELSRSRPFGGLLADAMGMGKTVMSLACVVGNPALLEDDSSPKSTLIIVPNAMVAKQWMTEADKHLNGNFVETTLLYSTEGAVHEKLRRSWIVIATIGEVRKQFKTLSTGAKRDQNKGLLFQLDWYRIILDEAHAIKNTNSLNKIACCALTGKHRWALSGTPLSNNTGEILPYLTFIGCDVNEDLKTFRRNYMTNGKGNEKLEALISMVMYRRTKSDKFHDWKILDLPELKIHNIEISLSTEETIFYNFIKNIRPTTNNDPEEEKEESMSQLSDDETEQSERSHIYRWPLKMAVSHPYNIEKLLRTAGDRDEIQKLREEISQASSNKSVLEQVLADEAAISQLQPYVSGIDHIQGCEDNAIGGMFDVDGHLMLIQNELEAKNLRCSECQNFCEDLVKLAEVGQATCVMQLCAAPMSNAHPFETMPSIIGRFHGKLGKPEPGMDSQKISLKRGDDNIGCFIADDYVTNLSQVPSSKLTVVMAILLSWLFEHPDDKVLVFTQFITTAKVLGRMLQCANVPFLYYYGCMTNAAKESAMNMMKDEPEQRVMITGLRCGGQSLNLTFANRVIIVDPWWNISAEDQAVGRIHRIGQTKVCHAVRIFTKTGEETELCALRKTKSEEVDYALQDDGHVPEPLQDEAHRAELYNFMQGGKKGPETGRKRKSG
ncbi:hypothetical protein QQS21_007504 [Conoideocrella luteorostrata]|uniref:P-loop containing nucleoside triphosphate hydrolase protein n=1 Tax=Conoideocrella luteorostrata TaxID=1105319 RepID=A0AAJ0CND9_9HYPO|nr:hypothetical protein QQS21_007504 [Conoideocrella luteorostrata]